MSTRDQEPESPSGPTVPPSADRARDERGRALNDRPRDALGRPLPRGAEGVPRQPEGIARTPADTIALGQQLLDGRRPFHAHDVFEDHWKQTAGPERTLWRGLAQLAVGITHAARGNPRGAAAVLDRATASIDPFAGEQPHGIDVAGVQQWCTAEAGRLRSGPDADDGPGAGAAPVWLEPPRLRSDPQSGRGGAR